MYRNLSRRVELLTPIKDPQLKAVLKDTVLSAYLKDNVNSRELRADGTYVRTKPAEGEKRFDSQMEFETVEFTPLKRVDIRGSAAAKARQKKADEAAT